MFDCLKFSLPAFRSLLGKATYILRIERQAWCFWPAGSEISPPNSALQWCSKTASSLLLTLLNHLIDNF